MRRLLLALLPGLALAGCGGLPTPPAADAPPEFEFRLGPGDRVRASLWGEQQLDREVEVGPDGVVSLPLIGDVRIQGLTLDEARVEIAQRYRAVLTDPVVSIEMLEMRSHVVHVMGEVARPGSVPYVRGATALGAIMAAGGALPATADLGDVRIVRDRMGATAAFALDADAVLAGEASDAWLLPGDLVYVPARLLSRWDRWWRQAVPWADPVDYSARPRRIR